MELIIATGGSKEAGILAPPPKQIKDLNVNSEPESPGRKHGEIFKSSQGRENIKKKMPKTKRQNIKG